MTVAHSIKKAAAKFGTPKGISIEFVIYGQSYAPTRLTSELDPLVGSLAQSFLRDGIDVRWCEGKDTPSTRYHLKRGDSPPPRASNLVAYFRHDGIVADEDRAANGPDWAAKQVADRMIRLLTAASRVLGR